MRDRKSDIHRILTEAELGRKLGPNEVVNHRNEDKDDNSRLNREVMDRGAHTAMHNRQRSLSKLRKSLLMVKRGERLY